MKLQQLFAKAQLNLLVLQCAAEGWDKDPDWLNRGEDGRFGGGGVAKVAKKTAEDAKEILDSTAKALGVTKDVIKLSLADSGFRERAGLSAGMGMAEIIKATSKAIGKTPELEKRIDSLVQQATDKLAKDYGGDKDPLAQAIRKSDGLEPPADSSISQKMEFAATKYQLYIEALANPEKYQYTPAQQQELVGKTIKASIPLVVDLAVNIGVGVAMGLLFRQSLSHALASAVLGEAVYRGIDKGLDIAKVDDPLLKTGIQLAVGLASGGVIELASKKIAGLGTKKVVAEGLKKAAAELAKKEAAEIAEREVAEMVKIVKKEAAELTEKEAAEIAKKGVAVNRPLVTNVERKVATSNSYGGTTKVTTTRFNVNENNVKMEINASVKHGETMVKDVEFKVGETYSKEKIPLDESTVIMYHLKKIFKQEVKDSAEGTIFKCMAYETDGAGETRVFFYKLMGFKERNGEFFGIVKNGKLVPH